MTSPFTVAATAVPRRAPMVAAAITRTTAVRATILDRPVMCDSSQKLPAMRIWRPMCCFILPGGCLRCNADRLPAARLPCQGLQHLGEEVYIGEARSARAQAED